MIEPVKSTSPARRLLLVVVIPLIVLLLGGWQIVRGTASVSEMAGTQSRLAAELVRLDALAALSPPRMIQFNDDPMTYSASAAAQKVRDASDDVKWEQLAARVRLGLAIAAAIGAAVALLAGLTGLAAAAWAQRQSRVSRAAVQGAFSRIRVMLPWMLASQIAGLTLSLASVGLFEIIGLVLYDELGTVTGRALEWGLAITGVILWFGWLALRELRRSLKAFTPAPMPIFGRSVPRGEAPELSTAR
jgi:hypothetical protein